MAGEPTHPLRAGRGGLRLASAGALTGLALGLAAGWLSARASGGMFSMRFAAPGRTPRAPASAPMQMDLPENPADRLRALDAILAEAKAGDARRPAALLERARLMLDEAASPALARADLEELLAHPHAEGLPEGILLDARALVDSGALAAALGEAERFCSLFPGSWRASEAALMAADILEALGRRSEATEIIESVLANDPDRAERAHLPIGERGRYPARAEPMLMRLGRLYLRLGNHAYAENAFELVARPEPGADDFGETYLRSPFLREAEVGRNEAEVSRGGERAAGARAALASLARDPADDAAGRRARMLAGLPERVPGERAWALIEDGSLDGAAGATLKGEAARAAAHALEVRAWLDPKGVLGVASAIDPGELDAAGREARSIARSRALEAQGMAAEAEAALRAYASPRLSFARAELARRRGDAAGVRAALSGAAASEFAGALIDRGATR